ncbi:hypothetical protein [Desulfofalx alkaliphila]|uniref:nucleotide-binding protein n=1 Tax=Desulfofalx alkaliphila TaxID=105483 RepID=UPI0004E288EF|nr:hypothetical protein [Desulfofalx alkaliphila]
MLDVPTRPVTIFTGNLGSGKTEISINFAVNLSKGGNKVSLVDLDIINPYFRTRLARDCLADSGLKLVIPPPDLANADVPALSPAIRGALQMEDGYCVCDVGGDDVGAIALGRFKPFLPPERFNLYFVVNACRPLTGTVDGILDMLQGIERNSRLKATALVNNTNLGAETDVTTVLAGEKIVSDAADALGLELVFTAARREIIPQLIESGLKTPVLPLNFYMLPPWKRED